jgi:aminoglycoside phosphotransferase (APT) family kinase protein
LHRQNPENAPYNSSRSVPLSTKEEAIQLRIKRLKQKINLITPRIETLWQEAIGEPGPTSPCLLHGDLHPRNIIVRGGQIEALIDWGDITAGDPATDLACLWMLFENDAARREALHQYGASTSLITRVIGWAIFFGITLLDTGLNSNPQHARIGESILKNIAL